VLRSWFPESTGAGAGRGRRNNRGAGGGGGGGGGGQRQDGNRGQPGPQRADNFGNVAPQGPSHYSASPGNSVHDGPPRGPRNKNNRFRNRGPRTPK
jgi:hypothetical protein